MDFPGMASWTGGGVGRPETAPPASTSHVGSEHEPLLNYDSVDGNSQQSQSQKAQQQRLPTFKEFGETIKQLQHENFQLKVALYLKESKGGKNQLHPSGTGNAHEPGGAPSKATLELVREFQNLRQANETLQLKVGDSENRIRSLQKQLEELGVEKEDLLNRNDVLMEKLDVLDRELALVKLKKQEDEDIEQCVQAFHGNDGVFCSGQIHAPNTPQFLEFQRHLVEELEKEKESWRAERSSLEEQLLTWKDDAQKHVQKIKEKDITIKRQDEHFKTTCEALHEMGVRYKTTQNENDELKKKIEDQKRLLSHQKENFEKSEKLASNAVQKQKALTERLYMTKKIMDLLKGRLTELGQFLEALLDLESRGIVHLTGLTSENRQTLRVSLEQSQLLSDTLVKSLAEDWNEEEQKEANKLKFSKLGLMQSEHVEVSKPVHETENNNLLDAGDVRTKSGVLAPLKTSAKLCTAAKSIQCERDSETNLETTSQINLLTTEKKKLEDTKNRLVTEKGILYARVATLEANLNAIKELSYPLQIEQLKIQIDKRTAEKFKMERQMHLQSKQVSEYETENRTLFERLQVSESALKRLHHEHARLVTELRGLRTVCPVKENYDKILKVGLSEANRQDSSPDLGIESGHDALSTVSSPAKPPPTNVKSTEEYKLLRSQNRELVSKLKHTKLALSKTLEKLDKATADKEQFEKAVCRELHQTHSILKEAQVQLEVDVPVRDSPFH